MKKRTTTTICSFALLGMLCVLANSCKKTETNTISDDAFYKQLGYSITSCYNDIYNQNLAGKPTGNQNMTVNGPMGGTVVITGTTSYDDTHGITTTDLVFSMTDVTYSRSTPGSSGKTYTTQITLTGATTHTGSFSDSYTSLNFQGNSIHLDGSVTYEGVVRNINQTGAIIINRSNSVTANIFGNIVTW